MQPSFARNALALLLLVAAQAHGFELERVDENPCGASPNLHWASNSAIIDASSLPAGPFQQLGVEAYQRWNQAVTSFRFNSSNGGASCNFGDGHVSLGLADTTCSGATFGDVLAFTVTSFNARTGQLFDADVRFNRRLLSPDAVFLQVAMHELGHVLGLDHSDACGRSGANTLMESRLSFNAARIDAPRADDIEGAQFVYGEGGGEPGLGPLTSAPNSCAVRSAPRRERPPLAALGVLLLVAITGRLTRRRGISSRMHRAP